MNQKINAHQKKKSYKISKMMTKDAKSSQTKSQGTEQEDQDRINRRQILSVTRTEGKEKNMKKE